MKVSREWFKKKSMQELCAGKMDSIKPENVMFQAAAAEAPILANGVPGYIGCWNTVFLYASVIANKKINSRIPLILSLSTI